MLTKPTFSLRILNAQMAITLHVLKTKTWFGFNLDGTLHCFRSASSTASLAVFSDIYERHNTPVTVLANVYPVIPKEKTRSAFTDNGTLTEYRKECSAALLKAYNVPSFDLSRRASSVYNTALLQR
jgi:putative hydrolase of the HAD superfamily